MTLINPPDHGGNRSAFDYGIEHAEARYSGGPLEEVRKALLHVYGGAPSERKKFRGLIGGHPLMRNLYKRIERAASFDKMNILIIAESGAGKDLAARAIHECSARRDRSFLALNCAGVSPAALERELFGLDEGVLGENEERRRGHFVEADGGTLFIDHIETVAPALLEKVIDAAENRRVTREDGTTVHTDVRVICAAAVMTDRRTESTLSTAEPYHRLWDIPIFLPPLRQRNEDVALLAQHFVDECARKNGDSYTIDDSALGVLTEYDWPGNVRELYSIIRRLAVIAPAGKITGRHARRCLTALPDPPAQEEFPFEGPGEGEGARQEMTKDSHAWTVEDEFPELTDLAAYGRLYGDTPMRAALLRALRTGGTIRNAMTLLAIPYAHYSRFRKWLQRMNIRVRNQKTR